MQTTLSHLIGTTAMLAIDVIVKDLWGILVRLHVPLTFWGS
jgi:hypothetical protein